MKTFSLGKRHKLCSKTAIDRLFDRRSTGGCESMLAYPLRAVWGIDDCSTPVAATREKVQFLITVPKKRLRHAVDRVTMRRRVREAYRLNRHEAGAAAYDGTPLDIAFIYIADGLEPYSRVEKSMQRILRRIFKPQQ